MTDRHITHTTHTTDGRTLTHSCPRAESLLAEDRAAEQQWAAAIDLAQRYGAATTEEAQIDALNDLTAAAEALLEPEVWEGLEAYALKATMDELAAETTRLLRKAGA